MYDEVFVDLNCVESVDGQSDLWVYYEKPVSGAIGRWSATGVLTQCQYTTVRNVDLDEEGTWVLQPWSDTYGVHGDKVEMQVFPPLFPFKVGSQSAYMIGV